MTCGIYAIHSIATNEVYIGKSVSTEERWDKHKLDLKSSKHVNSNLQEIYDKYGLTNFVFSIVSETHDITRLESIVYHTLKDIGVKTLNIRKLSDYRTITKLDAYMLGYKVLSEFIDKLETNKIKTEDCRYKVSMSVLADYYSVNLNDLRVAIDTVKDYYPIGWSVTIDFLGGDLLVLTDTITLNKRVEDNLEKMYRKHTPRKSYKLNKTAIHFIICKDKYNETLHQRKKHEMRVCLKRAVLCGDLTLTAYRKLLKLTQDTLDTIYEAGIEFGFNQSQYKRSVTEC